MKLTIENISKRFKDIPALDNISMELTEGIYGLLGPNGSGKTTMLRILADVLTPSNGRVLLNGEDKDALNDKYRSAIGYLPQELGLYKGFSAYKFLMYIAALKGIDKKTASQKTMELLELVNLKSHAKSLCGSFSGGMKRRLGIAQALLNDPQILILDEPTAGLDPEERIRFRNLIAGLGMDRIVIYATHIVSDIDMIAKEVILLSEGKVLRKDAEESLLSDIENKVWNVKVTDKQYAEIEKENYLISNISKRMNYIEIRMISETIPFPDAQICEPTYEDMYLYYFKQNSRSSSEEVT